MDIPVTIATVIAVTYSDRIPAYVDQVQTFVFFGEPSKLDREAVLQCAWELVEECTDQVSDEELYEALHNETFGDNKCVEFNDGNVSVHWERRL